VTSSVPRSQGLCRAEEGLDGRVVLIGLLACLLVTVLTPAGGWARLGGETALVLTAHGALWRSGVYTGGRSQLLIARLGLLAPFFLLAAVGPLFATGLPGQAPPSAQAGTLVARAVISFGAVAAAMQAVEGPGLLRALGRLRLPPILVTLAALLLRYLDLLADEAARMVRARDLRGTPPNIGARARVTGWMVGSLFLRSVERGERLSVAMQSRGFTGLLPSPPPRPLSRRDGLLLGALLLPQALLLAVT
jgi:cobalt/nickel transport system permease protein